MCAATIPAKSAVTSPPALNQTQWHAVESHDVSRALKVDPNIGLTPAEVNERQLRYGANALQRIQSRPAWRVLIDQFASIVIALLAIAAVISWATGDGAEAIAILIVLILNAAVGFATEWQAGRALDALRRQSRTLTRVRRNGFESTVEAEGVVPGDSVVRTPGVGVS